MIGTFALGEGVARDGFLEPHDADDLARARDLDRLPRVREHPEEPGRALVAVQARVEERVAAPDLAG